MTDTITLAACSVGMVKLDSISLFLSQKKAPVQYLNYTGALLLLSNFFQLFFHQLNGVEFKMLYVLISIPNLDKVNPTKLVCQIYINLIDTRS